MDNSLKWKYYDDFEVYRKENGYEEEMYNYYRLSSDATKIPVDIWFDDCKSYIMNEHPLWLYFMNGYSREISEFIPINISDNPEILISNPDLNIDEYDLESIRQFIITFKNELTLVANDELTNYKFALFVRIKNKGKPIKWRGYDDFEKYKEEGSLEELMEYYKLSPNVTNIPVEIWFDNCKSYVRHNHLLWLYFRNSYTIDVGDFIPISISREPQIMINNSKINIDEDIILKIKEFIIRYREELVLVANDKMKEIDFEELVKMVEAE